MRFVQPMVAMPGLPQQQYQQLYRPQQQMMFRPAQPQPNPQASNSKPSNKGQQGHSTQEAGKQMSNPRGRSGSESSGNQDSSRQPEKKNPFIPHQVRLYPSQNSIESIPDYYHLLKFGKPHLLLDEKYINRTLSHASL